MSGEPEETLQVLRAIWSASSTPDLASLTDEGAGEGKHCKRLAEVGFGGESGGTGAAGDSSDQRAAWRARLAREGKLAPVSVADLVLRQAEPGG